MFVLFSTLWLALTLLRSSSGQAHLPAISCCSNAAEFEACKHHCNELDTEGDLSLRYQKLRELPKHCPGHLVYFWRCLNDSNPEISPYIGTSPSNYARTCCLLPSSLECRRACREGKLDDPKSNCSKLEESAMFRCVERYQASRRCCRSTTLKCIKACQVVFSSDQPPSLKAKNDVKKTCARYGQHVISCVANVTAGVKSCSVPESDSRRKVLKCCKRLQNDDLKCKRTCRQDLQSQKSGTAMISNLVKACGEPFAQNNEKRNGFWTCLIENSEKNPAPVCPTGTPQPPSPVLGIDSAKLQCCSKAKDSGCWRLCIQMYKSSWGRTQNWREFDVKCGYNPREVSMMNCLADVTEPCQLGCSGLSFCTNFNNRHTELFRSCKRASDKNAKSYMLEWTKGYIQIPNTDIKIPIMDIKKCLPETWKAIACILQIKPCSIKSHRSTICRPDCVAILQRCRNSSSDMGGLSAEDVCDALSPPDKHAPCISLKEYLVPSKYEDVTDEVTHPCNPNPCEEKQVCDINRRCFSAILDRCQSYTCVPGCPLGDESSFLVRVGEFARVPDPSGRAGCYKICHCDGTSKLSKCKSLDCIRRKPCYIPGKPMAINDGELFMDDCNLCTCFSGEVTCTKSQCPASVLSPEYNASRPKRNQTPGNESIDTDLITTLPCGCDNVYQPLCGGDGKTYPNPCVARCMGLRSSDYTYGNCASIDPCESNPCAADEKCIVERKTCLSVLDHCSQFYCVSEGKYCSDLQLDPVCDTDNRQHPNLCSLQFNGKSLAYKGFCKDECKPSSPAVCGVNGETYSSTCAADSARVLIDYRGRCRAVGVGDGDEPRCKNVKCPKVNPPDCTGIIPPGACCPHCAAEVRILYSLKQLMKNREGFSIYETVTLEQLFLLLRRHISTTECDLFGYHSLEGDIVVLVMAVTGKPTILQVETCNREAQRLEAFVNTGTPAFTSDIVLSALKGARSRVPLLSRKSQQPVSNVRKSKASVVNNSLIVSLLPIIMLPVILRTGRS